MLVTLEEYDEYLEEDARWSRGGAFNDVRWADQLDRWVMAIRRLGPLWRYSEEFIAVDGGKLGDVRNRLYEIAINGECSGYDDPDVDREDLDPPSPACGCGWCMAVVLLNRVDHWLDRAGSPKSAYIDDVGPEIEIEWRRYWRDAPPG